MNSQLLLLITLSNVNEQYNIDYNRTTRYNIFHESTQNIN